MSFYEFSLNFLLMVFVAFALSWVGFRVFNDGSGKAFLVVILAILVAVNIALDFIGVPIEDILALTVVWAVGAVVGFILGNLVERRRWAKRRSTSQ